LVARKRVEVMSALSVWLGNSWYVTIPLGLMALVIVRRTVQWKAARSDASRIQRYCESLQEKASRAGTLERELAAARTELGRLESGRRQAEVAAARQLEDASRELADSRSECARHERETEQLRGQLQALAATQEDLVQALAASRRQNEEDRLSNEVLRQRLDVEGAERTRAEERFRGQAAMTEESRRRVRALARDLEQRTRELRDYRLERIAFLEAECAKSRQDEAEARNRREASEAELRSVRDKYSEAQSFLEQSQAAAQEGCEPQPPVMRESFAQGRDEINDRLIRQSVEIESLKKTLEMIGILA
jgi:chromosome segregation ATPase